MEKVNSKHLYGHLLDNFPLGSLLIQTSCLLRVSVCDSVPDQVAHRGIIRALLQKQLHQAGSSIDHRAGTPQDGIKHLGPCSLWDGMAFFLFALLFIHNLSHQTAHRHMFVGFCSGDSTMD